MTADEAMRYLISESMTPGEKIEQMWKAVEDEHGALSRRESFVALTAMEWADKTILDRACEWLSIYYPSIDRIGIDKFVTAFRQAMEGGGMK